MLEPVDTVLNGAGQAPDAYSNFVNVMDPNEHPELYMTYWALGIGPQDIDSLIADLESYNQNNEYLVVQIGLYIVGMETDIAAGLRDADIENLCQTLERLGHPVYLRIGYEANCSCNNYDPTAYKQAFIRITNAIRNHNLEVATVWNIIPAASSQYMPYYPGDGYVDWWSINLFSNWSIITTYTTNFLNEAELRNKPVLIGESSPTDNNTDLGQASWSGWFIPFFILVENYPAIKALGYINTNWDISMPELGWGECRLEVNEIVAQNYRDEMDSSLYQHAMDEQSFRAEIMGANDIIPPGKVTGLTANVNTSSQILSWNPAADGQGINRYKIQRDGQLIGYSNDESYEDGRLFAGNTYYYTVTAIDDGGNQGPQSSQAMVVLPPSIEKIINGEFDLGVTGWSTGWYSGGLSMSQSTDTTSKLSGPNSHKFIINQVTGTDWHLQYYQPLKTKQNYTYNLTYMAVADRNTSMTVTVLESHWPYASFIVHNANLTTSPQTFTISGVAPDDDNVSLIFLLGASAPRTIWIDDISIVETSNNPDPQNCDEVYSRNFDLLSDLTGDCYIDMKDFIVLANYWMDTNCTPGQNCEQVDFVDDDKIDYLDLADWASQWLNCNNPQDQSCTANWPL